LIAGRYELERELGRGGMAVVWLARDTELDRPVAVKILAEHLAGDPEFRDRFLREARIAGRLAHPNLVRVFDVGEDDGLPFIVMEYVEGRTLEGVHVEAPEATRLGLQLCAGLEQAHAAGVVHRDLKPGNLLLRADGTLKIADFGIARAVEETRMTQAGTVLGTLAYLAPEQAAGHEVTTAADIYSLGVVLRNLIEGPVPRDGGRALRVARAIETGVISINDNTSVRVSTPFGGFKQSGVGRELGPDALDAYTEVKNVYFKTEEG